jgi:uncharacterized damage-inducible protein DinB
MKELLTQYASYNLWAHQKLLELILALPEEKQKQELPSSFKSIESTVLHMWDAESIWWQRMKMLERVQVPGESYKGNMQEACSGLLAQSALWKHWVESATDMALDHVFQYYSTKRELFKQPTWQMILHVFNHGTYHRGQLVNMLRQSGVEKIPQTDFIVWSRKK